MGVFDGCGHTIRGLYMKDVDHKYIGLFGTTKKATIKNICIEDCLISGKFEDCGYIGTLCGLSNYSTFHNIKISNSRLSKEEGDDGAGLQRIGGIVGYSYTYDATWRAVLISNSSFEGTISLSFRSKSGFFDNQSMYCGGIIGTSDSGVITNCTVRGNMYVQKKQEESEYEVELYLGGLAGSHYGPLTNSVNYMDTHLYCSTFQERGSVRGYNLDYNLIGAFTSGETTKLANCVNFGNVYVGKNDGIVRNYEYLRLYGMRGSEIEDCANYGSFIFRGGIDNTNAPELIAGFSSPKLTRCINIQDKNVIPNIAGKTKVLAYTYDRGDATATDCHFYFNEEIGKLYSMSDLPSGAYLAKSLNDFKGKVPFFTSGYWGIVKDETSAYNGCPMPVPAGGFPSEYAGDGTSESTAYIINTEADLNKLKEYVNNGNAFEGKYFKLGSDISITGTLDECIGSYEKPFKGHFDGNGHAIIGLRKSLFGYMYGTVKNLALVDCDIWQGNYATALARQVGDTDNKAEVGNCYVSGTISFSTPWNQLGYASTFAFQIAAGSSVHDCYFKGRFVVKEQTFSTYNVAGIAIYDNNKTVNTSAESPEGIFNCYASFDVKVEASVWQTRYTYGISSESLNDESKGNYFVCSDNGVHQSNNGGIKLNSESELNEKFKDKSAWLQGVYRPVLASAKKYKATTPETTPETVYFDAIPEENHKKNYFYNISIDDPYSDVSLWSLPNMAVYVPSEKKDYITNGNLVQSADFQYKRATGATATAGQLRYDLTQNASGYHMLCLPGVVERGDLPQGSKVMIYGKIRTTGTSQEINEVHVDTIPAGVPCILYVPTSAYAEGSDIPLVMRSEIRTEPLVDANYSNMKGTFTTVTNVSDACITADKHEDDKVYFKKSPSAVSMKPFTAWLEGATGEEVQIVDYVLLDEENEAMTVTLAGLNSTSESSKTTNVKMRRTVKLGQWNTICLPFDLTKAEVEATFGSGTKVEELSSLNYDATSKSYTLVFAAVKEADGSFMKAGTPYLIKPGTTKTEAQTYVQLYAFTGKNIICPADENYLYTPAGKEVTNNVNSTKLTMQGEYNHRIISPDEATDGKSLYVISGDKIYYVDSEVEMKGFRCYFVAEESTTGSTEGGTGALGTSMFSNARVLHSDGSSTDLRLIKADTTGEGGAVYDLLGRKRDEQTKGIVIENGKKIIIK